MNDVLGRNLIITVIFYYAIDIYILYKIISIIRKIRKREPISIINWEQSFRYVKSEKVKKNIERVFRILLIFIFFLCLYEIVIPSVQDLPYVLTGTCEKEEGAICEVGIGVVSIDLENKKKIDISVPKLEAQTYEEGEKVVVLYYPHMERGFIYRQDELL